MSDDLTQAQFLDIDRDGLPAWLEVQLGTDPYSADTDRDGIDDGEEVRRGSNPRSPNSMAPPANLAAVGQFAQQVGSLQGSQYVFEVQPNLVTITALDGRSGINGAGLIYHQYAGQIESELRQKDLDNFAVVQHHLFQATQAIQPSLESQPER
jgi:hypothetical protein